MVSFSERAARKQALYALSRAECALEYWKSPNKEELAKDIPATIAKLEKEILERKAALEIIS